MTSATKTHTPRAQDIILFVTVGSHRITFTAAQLRDTVASYLARGNTMPTPTDINHGDPIEPLHVIAEEWLYGNVENWVNATDVVRLEHYRHHALQWIRGHFGPAMIELDDQPVIPASDGHTAP
jgi:hypothetical protein